MEMLNCGQYADWLTAEMTKLHGFAKPGASDEQDAIVHGAVMSTIKYFLAQKQYQKKKIEATVTNLGAANHAALTRELVGMKSRGGAISIAYYGESHESQADAQRAYEFLRSNARARPDLPTLIVVERGLRNRRNRGGRSMAGYDMDDCQSPFIDEDNLTRSESAPLEYKIQYRSIWGFGLSREQRSMVVAGYLAICLANGDQTAIERIVALFGQNHSNLMEDYLEYYIQTVATNLWARRRHYILAGSLG